MMNRWRTWRARKVRALEWGSFEGPDGKTFRPYHVTFTPRFAFSIPWPGGRIRCARHHGLQFIQWNGRGRWTVARQILGRSSVRGESFQPSALPKE